MESKNFAVSKVGKIWDSEAFKLFQMEELDESNREFRLQRKMQLLDVKIKKKIISLYVDLKLNDYIDKKFAIMKKVDRDLEQAKKLPSKSSFYKINF